MTDTLNYGSYDGTDMDEDVYGNPEENMLATTHTGNWAATSTYGVYIVDTPEENSKDEPNVNTKRRRPKGDRRDSMGAEVRSIHRGRPITEDNQAYPARQNVPKRLVKMAEKGLEHPS